MYCVVGCGLPEPYPTISYRKKNKYLFSITITMENKYIKEFQLMKAVRREKKRINKRSITGEEVIFIFEKILEGWKTIKIYNIMIQNNPTSNVSKKMVETISTGNCKVYSNELSKEKYSYYLELRKKVYAHHSPESTTHCDNYTEPE